MHCLLPLDALLLENLAKTFTTAARTPAVTSLPSSASAILARLLAPRGNGLRPGGSRAS